MWDVRCEMMMMMLCFKKLQEDVKTLKKSYLPCQMVCMVATK